MIRKLGSVLLATTIVAAGCVTTTSHRVSLVGNRLADEAATCAAECRRKNPAIVQSACNSSNNSGYGAARSLGCTDRSIDHSETYAFCLDSCPGATALAGVSCSELPAKDAICAETTKANPGAIAGGVVAATTVGVSIVAMTVLVAALSSPWILLAILLAPK